MERKAISRMMLTMLSICMLTLTFKIQLASARTITVPDEYASIQEAVNAAGDSDTVLIRTGVYYEHVIVDKPINLVGEEKQTTVIDGGGSLSALTITASHVKVNDITVRNSEPTKYGYACIDIRSNDNTISDCRITSGRTLVYISGSTNRVVNCEIYGSTFEYWFAFYLEVGSDYNYISNCIIFGNQGYSIEILGSHNVLTDCSVYNSRSGITLGVGNYPGVAHDNVISNCIIHDSVVGIFVTWSSNRNKIINCTSYHNDMYGVWMLGDCNYNIMSGCIIYENNVGIAIGMNPYSTCNNNHFFHNNIKDNVQQVFIQDSSNNVWDDGYPSGGNYWSDYTGADANGDGIGDTSYVIDTNNIDHYPLMNPWAPLPQPDFEISVSPESRSVQVGDSVTYQVSLIPEDGFSSEVSLDLSGLPAGSSFSFDPPKITPGISSTLTIVTDFVLTPLMESTVTVTGTSGSISRSVTFSLETILSLEISVESFYTKSDVSRPFFKFDFDGQEWCRAPKKGSELDTSKAWKEYPGPLYVPYAVSPHFPLLIEVKAFSTDWLGGENEIGTASFTLWIREMLPTTFEFDLTDVYMKIHVRQIAHIKIPDPYYPNGITEEHTPELLEEWYWFAVGADRVWQEYENSDFNEVVVAVLDSGVDYNHPALENAIWINQGETGIDSNGRDKKSNGIDDDSNGYIDDWHGYDFVLFGDSDPMDEGFLKEGTTQYHGTSVAGVIAAQAETESITGVAAAMKDRIKIMPVRVLHRDWLQDPQLDVDTDWAEGIDYAAKNGAEVIVMSIGGSLLLPKTESALQRAVKQGVTIVAAAGNDRTMKSFYPASYDSAISVSGLKKLDSSYVGFWIYSGEGEGGNYGPRITFSKGVSVEVCAPAVEVLATTKDAGTVDFGGTSAAAPIVAATAALIKGYASQKYNRDLNPNEIRHIIRTSGVDMGSRNWDAYYGYGMVSAYDALKKVDELLGRKHWQIKLDPPVNLDLHVYDALGRHVGLDYSTGQLEVEIPGATHTGDESGGFETIFLPLDITDYRLGIINMDSQDSDFALEIASFDFADMIMGETHSDVIQANGELAYTITATEGGDFQSQELSISVDKLFKPSEIKQSRKGAIMSRTNITNTGELTLSELTFEDVIPNGWTVKNVHSISATLFIGGVKYDIPYDEFAYVAIEDGKYIAKLNFTDGIDLYQFNATSGLDEYRMAVYAFEPGWIVEIKYPMYLLGDATGDGIVDVFDILFVKAHRSGPPPGPFGYDENADVNNDGAVDLFDLLTVKSQVGGPAPGEYTSSVSVTVVSVEGITIRVEDAATLTVN
ncbi:MAG: S8 family serine peptidase [Candidatus Hodarchaeota archaeon]